jgi:hypothetical protein
MAIESVPSTIKTWAAWAGTRLPITRMPERVRNEILRNDRNRTWPKDVPVIENLLGKSGNGSSLSDTCFDLIDCARFPGYGKGMRTYCRRTVE